MHVLGSIIIIVHLWIIFCSWLIVKVTCRQTFLLSALHVPVPLYHQSMHFKCIHGTIISTQTEMTVLYEHTTEMIVHVTVLIALKTFSPLEPVDIRACLSRRALRDCDDVSRSLVFMQKNKYISTYTSTTHIYCTNAQ